LIFGPREHFKLIEIPILNDGITESGETFSVVLTNATEGAISENFDTAIITIRDYDPGFSLRHQLTALMRPRTRSFSMYGEGRTVPKGSAWITPSEADTALPGIDYLLATCPRINKTTWHQPSRATIKLSWIREKSR